MRAFALVFLSIFSVPSKCESKSQKTNEQILIYSSSSLLITRSLISFASGQLIVGGSAGSKSFFSSVEIFPPPIDDTCSIPNLPEANMGMSLSHLPGGKLVACGGNPISKACLVWTSSHTSWTHLYNMRSSFYIFHTNKELTFQFSEKCPCGLESTIASRLHCVAGQS